MSITPNLDRFGIAEIAPRLDGGRVWTSQWDNQRPRLLCSVQQDPCDPEFSLRGNSGRLEIDGNGVARLSGHAPRMYVYDSSGHLKWRNVEITFYARRIDETERYAYSGFVAGARSEHQNINPPAGDPCNAHTYYGRILYSGRVHFIKELRHDSDDQTIYAPTRPPGNRHVDWGTGSTEMPRCQWYGVKMIVQNVDQDRHVRLRLFLDMAEGQGGGDWKIQSETTDCGDWTAPCSCPHPTGQILTEAATSVFVRNDRLIAAEYRQFSIREISAE